MDTIQTTKIHACRDASEDHRTVNAMVLGFSSDPVMRWLYPDPASYLEYFPQFGRAFGGRAFEHGSAYYAADFLGAAMWLPPSVEPDTERFVELIQRSVDEAKQRIVFETLQQMERFHPTEPCWYLALIGVDPAHQRRGLGSALMREVLDECDRQNLPSYLESTNPRNVTLYERHGFRRLGIIDTGEAPPLTPMLREPRAS
jgi:ribosomal protein S18 acetylase RimI-like enzyme